ncbi:hypothetical protein L7F22_051509 [Adiantum nelumboides]|nr:hypothetical protein [Adiantum nelumboides]
MCRQAVAARASKNVMHVESLCYAAHILCSLPTLGQAHTDADASNKRKQTVDSVAPTTTISPFKGFAMPQTPLKAAGRVISYHQSTWNASKADNEEIMILEVVRMERTTQNGFVCSFVI